MQPDANERQDTAGAAQARADDARRRALAARQAADRATTDHARRAHYRAADVYRELALSHEDFARRVRFGGGREGAERDS